VATEVPAWHEISALVGTELGEPVRDGQPLTSPRTSRMTWAARTPDTGAIVVKARRGDSAFEKTKWCAQHLPALGVRGYPVPAILWHGMIIDEWHVTVQNRLPGRPFKALDAAALQAVLSLVELQADAGFHDEERDFTGYVANVLFEDWDEVWADAPRASEAAGPLCARVRRWLEPVWGMRLPPADFANNDLNLSNILADGSTITGVVDWDEFALGSRALDLVGLAIDCERGGNHAVADRLLAQAARVAGEDGLRCLVSYRAIALLAHSARERDAYGDSLADAECVAVSAVLDRLEAFPVWRDRAAR
jgi:aminoglycoside phosphotransferase (APT) family kinase protein